MASESAFNKKLTAETNMDKVEGLLEHFNLPPKVIDFIRVNQRILQIAIAIIVIAVVFWSLYGSYRERIREEASTALSTALQTDKAGQAEALRAVVDKYAGTSSALWARVELAHLDMKNGSYADAAKKYTEILPDVKTSNPLHPLVLFGLAQALEGEKRFEEAAKQYDLLKNIKGYEQIAYAGMGRIEESQGHIDKAIAIYNDFLLFMGEDAAFAQDSSGNQGEGCQIKGSAIKYFHKYEERSQSCRDLKYSGKKKKKRSWMFSIPVFSFVMNLTISERVFIRFENLKKNLPDTAVQSMHRR